MSQADRDTLEAIREAADAIDGDARKKLGTLAAKYIPDIIKTAKRVMDDTESRQSLNAAALMAEWATGAEADGGGKGDNVKVLVVNAPDIQRLGEIHRQALAAEKLGAPR